MGRFPGNYRFAFTIVDDTDGCTLENVAPVYRLLTDLGFRTTKTVWPLANVAGAPFAASTLQDEQYREFILDLMGKGFEIGLHNVRNSDSTREVVELGLRECLDKIGVVPKVQINHHCNRDNIYWGHARFTTFPNRQFYNGLHRLRGDGRCDGHVDNSPYFWGDLCRTHITYVRSLVFGELNLDRVNTTLPYSNPTQPYVNYWFTSSSGSNVSAFCDALCEPNQDCLEEEGGVAIIYTHFASGFVDANRVHTRFSMLMSRLAKKNGWFVPVSTLLDHLRATRADHRIPPHELRHMESSWLKYRVTHSL